MKRVERNRAFLEQLSKAKTRKKQVDLIRAATEDQLHAIVEVLLNYDRFLIPDQTSFKKQTKSAVKKFLAGIKKTSPALIRKKLMQCCRHIVPVLGYTLSKILQSALTALFSGSDEPETLQSSSSG